MAEVSPRHSLQNPPAKTTDQFDINVRSPDKTWDNDSCNPFNWPISRKYNVTLLLSAMTFNTLMSSTIIAPALPWIQKNLGIDSEALTQLVLSIYVLSYCVGYLFWAPLSEVYGRRVIFQVAGTWFCVWNLACGFAKNTATIAIARLFAGSGAAASLALGTGAIAEIWRPEQRGKSLAVLSLLTLLGPCIGPVIGAAAAQGSSSSWRWAFWATSASNFLLQIIAFPILHESHAPTILKHEKRKKIQHEKKIQIQLTEVARMDSTEKITWNILVTAMKRPFYLTFTQPACVGLVLYACVNFGCVYIVIAATSLAFSTVYQQSLIVSSLNYLSFGIGTILAAQLNGLVMDKSFQQAKQKHNTHLTTDIEDNRGIRTASVPQPELRLFALLPMTFLLTGGFILFGWTIHYKQHWILPNLGTVLVGFGSQGMTLCTNAYVMDCYSGITQVQRGKLVDEQSNRGTSGTAGPVDIKLNWTASAMAAIWMFKSLGGFAFPLFGMDMVFSLGWGWSFTILGLVNLVVGFPVTLILLLYGPKLRDIGRRKMEQKMSDGML